ncbi:MAG: phosphopantetheinyl transferase [Parvicella sp.]|jgi:phosphopantetheinyl transferase
MCLPSIEIWLYQDDCTDLNPLISRLPAPQKKRALQLHRRRQREFVIGRSLLSLAIQRNSASNNWLINERPHSSPIVEHPSEKFISNISHSKGWVALAFCNTPVDSHMSIGLDIERIKPREQFAAADFFCNASQLRQLKAKTNNQDKSRYFSLLWTQKEAYFKAHQQTIWNSQIKTISFDENKLEDAAQHQKMRSAYDGQRLALSVFCNTPSDINVWRFTEISSSGTRNTNPVNLQWQSYSVTGGNHQ